MTPTLKDQIAAAVVLICDVRQDTEHVHKLIQALCDQAHCEGYMAGLDRSQAIIEKHLGRIVEVA